LELVRDGLGFHPEGVCQVAYTQFVGSDQSVEQAKAGVVCENFENRREATGLDG